jgi:hypothetical protein
MKFESSSPEKQKSMIKGNEDDEDDVMING